MKRMNEKKQQQQHREIYGSQYGKRQHNQNECENESERQERNRINKKKSHTKTNEIHKFMPAKEMNRPRCELVVKLPDRFITNCYLFLYLVVPFFGFGRFKFVCDGPFCYPCSFDK